MVKACFKCHATKPIDDFYRHGQMADGRLNKCKECTKADTRANYAENIDQHRAYERTRANLEHRVEARKAYAATDRGRVAGNRGKRAYWSSSKYGYRFSKKEIEETFVGSTKDVITDGETYKNDDRVRDMDLEAARLEDLVKKGIE